MIDSAMERATEVLTGLVAGDEHPLAIRHPLGFFCIPAVRDGSDGICVHVWDSAANAAPPHAHSWELTSYVLHGTLGNRRIAVTDDERAPTHRLYHVDSVGDVDHLRATRRLVRWAVSEERSTGTGGVYRLPSGEFHLTTVPPGTRAVTLVVGRTVGGVRDLVVGAISDESRDMVRQRCTVEETTALARLVLDLVRL